MQNFWFYFEFCSKYLSPWNIQMDFAQLGRLDFATCKIRWKTHCSIIEFPQPERWGVLARISWDLRPKINLHVTISTDPWRLLQPPGLLPVLKRSLLALPSSCLSVHPWCCRYLVHPPSPWPSPAPPEPASSGMEHLLSGRVCHWFDFLVTLNSNDMEPHVSVPRLPLLSCSSLSSMFSLVWHLLRDLSCQYVSQLHPFNMLLFAARWRLRWTINSCPLCLQCLRRSRTPVHCRHNKCDGPPFPSSSHE